MKGEAPRGGCKMKGGHEIEGGCEMEGGHKMEGTRWRVRHQEEGMR